MKEKNLKELVDGVKRGEQAAFTELYERTKNKAFFVAAQYVEHDDVADILQDAYTAAYGAIDTFDSTKEFTPWLHAIIRNRCLDLLRKREDFLLADSDQNAETEEMEAFIPFTWVENKEKRQEILRIINNLSDTLRVVVMLFYYEGYSVTEIADELDIAEGTVKSRLSNARKAIKEKVLMEEQKGNKLYGVGAPILTQMFRREEVLAKIPAEMSKAVLDGVLTSVTGSAAVATGTGIIAKFIALGAGAKAVAVGAAVVLVGTGVGIPVYTNYSAEQEAVAAIAQVQTVISELNTLTSVEEYRAIKAAVTGLEGIRGHEEEVAAITAQMQTFEVAAFQNALTTLQTDYSNQNVLATNLQSLSQEVTRLNARLALNDTFTNADEIKATIQDASKVVWRVDLADPTVTVDDKATATTELDRLKTDLDTSLEAYGLTRGAVTAERIEVAKTALDGTVGDTFNIGAAVYPTHAEEVNVTYITSDTTVAEVDANGDTVFMGAGSGIITVTEATSGLQTTIAVTVKAKPVEKPQEVQKLDADTQKPAEPKAVTPKAESGAGMAETITREEEKASWLNATNGKADDAADWLDLSPEERWEILQQYG